MNIPLKSDLKLILMKHINEILTIKNYENSNITDAEHIVVLTESDNDKVKAFI